jgi:hypothetical protein
MSHATALVRPAGFRHVVVVSGHVTDAPDRSVPRFPEDAVRAVQRTLHAVLDGWGVGEDDLLVCGGARGADLVAADAARSLGATVWLLLAAAPEAFVESSVVGGDPSWVDTFWQAVQRTPSWVLERDSRFAGRDDIYAAANEWMLEVATAQAGAAPARLVVVWDRAPAAGAGGTAHMVAEAHDRGAPIVIIDPLTGDVVDEPPAARVAR